MFIQVCDNGTCGVCLRCILNKRERQLSHYQKLSGCYDDPSLEAYSAYKRGIHPEWVKEVVENDDIGSPSRVVYCMLIDKFPIPIGWAKKVIENDKNNERIKIAEYLCQLGYVPEYWVKSLKEEEYQ